MSTPYERLIDFCKAEVVSPTKSWVEVRDKGAYFSIYFRRLAWLAEVRKPSEADSYNKTRQRDVLYEDRPKWNDLCEMLGLNSPWVACADRLPEVDGEYLIWDGDAKVAYFEIAQESWSVFHSDAISSWFEHFHPTHWMPKFTDPT